MKPFQNILVAVNTRNQNHPGIKEACKTAEAGRASIRLVDVLPHARWTTRLVTKDHRHVEQLMLEEKARKLEDIAACIREQGIDVTTAVLRGHTSMALIVDAISSKCDLLIRATKGSSSEEPSHLGRTAKQLLRKCPIPVWLVKPGSKCEHVMMCLDTSSVDAIDDELNEVIFHAGNQLHDTRPVKLSVVHVWDIWNEAMLRKHMPPDDLKSFYDAMKKHASESFEVFLTKHKHVISSHRHFLIHGSPTQVIPKLVSDENVDLLVLGTIGRSGVQGLLVGNTAEHIFNKVNCSIMAVKPPSFENSDATKSQTEHEQGYLSIGGHY